MMRNEDCGSGDVARICAKWFPALVTILCIDNMMMASSRSLLQMPSEKSCLCQILWEHLCAEFPGIAKKKETSRDIDTGAAQI